MAKKDINIFGTSFLDLLSGALASVIILFVIVPKKTSSDVVIIEKFKELEVVATEVQDLTAKLKESVPKDVFKEISKEMDELRRKISDLRDKIRSLEEDIKKTTEENKALKQKVEEQTQEIEKLKEQLRDAQIRAKQAERSNSTANTVEKTLGVFAKFGILLRWEQTDTDVDMGVQRFGESPEQCWRMHASKIWGILGEDVRERVDEDTERFELFYVPEIYPDEYTAWCNIYSKSTGRQASVTATLIFHPGHPDEQRYEVGPFTIKADEPNKSFVTFRLTKNGFTVLQHREPIWGTGKVVK